MKPGDQPAMDNGIAMETINCYLCGKREETFLFDARDLLHGLGGVFRLVRCNACGLIYLNPRPTVEALPVFYPDDYIVYQPKINRLKSKPAMLSMMHQRIKPIQRFHRLAPSVRLLDIGCGNGKFLYWLAQKTGCQAIGVEFNGAVSEFCRMQLNLDVRQGTLQENRFEDAFFDVVTMWHYFEHEPFPLEILAEVRRILKPTGLLVMEMPNFESWAAKVFKSRWLALEAPRHLVHYSPSTIKSTLQKVGFEVRAVNHLLLTPFTLAACLGSWWYLLSGGGMPNARKIMALMAALMLFFLSFPLLVVAGVLKKSDHMRVFAQLAEARIRRNE